MLEVFEDKELNELLDGCYRGFQNYKEHSAGSNVLCIFFTSNGLYETGDAEDLKKRVINNDYYEYCNLTQTKYYVRKKYDSLFLRDIYLSWYTYGINEKINSQPAVAEFLAEKAKSYDEVITVGSSAGGYAAILFGTQINASKIIAFGPQNDLNVHFEFYKNSKRYSYFDVNSGKVVTDLLPLIETYNGSIYYFYAKGAKVDSAQYSCLEKQTNVVAFPIKSDDHGRTLLAENMLDVICSSDKKLKKIAMKNKGEIGAVKICFLTGGLFRFPAIMLRKLYRTIVKKRKHIL